MPVTAPEPLVSTAWLAEHLDDPLVRVVDCRWYLRPFDERCGDEEYRAGHIPGAVHLRWDTELADPDRPASMRRRPERFAAAMEEARRSATSTFVVTYDDHHVPVAARVWWALRVYGHDAVAVLDGGITAWRSEGRPIVTDVVDARAGPRSRARFQPQRYATQGRTCSTSSPAAGSDLGDARMDQAYDAASGHIPGFAAAHGTRVPGRRRALDDAGRRRGRIESAIMARRRRTPVITYCGGGVAATATALGLPARRASATSPCTTARGPSGKPTRTRRRSRTESRVEPARPSWYRRRPAPSARRDVRGCSAPATPVSGSTCATATVSSPAT